MVLVFWLGRSALAGSVMSAGGIVSGETVDILESAHSGQYLQVCSIKETGGESLGAASVCLKSNISCASTLCLFRSLLSLTTLFSENLHTMDDTLIAFAQVVISSDCARVDICTCDRTLFDRK